ncbi:MAG: DNA glycosylase AlkZ-like family protein [Candidatus Heimdallarchaeota archaeon]
MDLQKFRLYQLKKQNLLIKEKQTNYQKILFNHIALHSTDYLTPYISLWSRVEDFDPMSLFNAIKNKEAVRLRAMRRTVFVSHSENLPVLLPAISKVLEPYKMDNIKHLVNKMGMPEDLPEKISRDIIILLEKKNALTTSQIKKELSNKYKGDFVRAIITLLEFECAIARVDQRYITDKIIIWGLFSKNYPELLEKKIEQDEAIKQLFMKYLEQFGPATIEDFCWWLPLKKTPAKQMISDLQDELSELDFNNKKYYMTKKDHRDYESFDFSLDEPIINFLPYEDHFPKAFTIRNWFISEELAEKLTDKGTINMGQIRPSIWINGEIKGRWEINWLDDKKTKLEIQLTYLSDDVIKTPNIMKLVENERITLEAFYNAQLIPVMKRQ